MLALTVSSAGCVSEPQTQGSDLSTTAAPPPSPATSTVPATGPCTYIGRHHVEGTPTTEEDGHILLQVDVLDPALERDARDFGPSLDGAPTHDLAGEPVLWVHVVHRLLWLAPPASPAFFAQLEDEPSLEHCFVGGRSRMESSPVILEAVLPPGLDSYGPGICDRGLRSIRSMPGEYYLRLEGEPARAWGETFHGEKLLAVTQIGNSTHLNVRVPYEWDAFESAVAGEPNLAACYWDRAPFALLP